MPLVRILKAHGFEQVGDIVSYRGDLEAALAEGSVEVLESDPRLVVNSQTLIEEEQTPVVEPEVVAEPEASVIEEPVAPEPEAPVVEEVVTPEPEAPVVAEPVTVEPEVLSVNVEGI